MTTSSGNNEHTATAQSLGKSLIKYGFTGFWAGMIVAAIAWMGWLAFVFFTSLGSGRSGSLLAAEITMDPNGGFEIIFNLMALAMFIVIGAIAGAAIGLGITFIRWSKK